MGLVTGCHFSVYSKCFSGGGEGMQLLACFDGGYSLHFFLYKKYFS